MRISLFFQLPFSSFFSSTFSTSFFSSFSFLISVFHSVSAFCNAGFSLFKNSFQDFQGDIMINLVISLLIISGGIGFIVLRDLCKRFFGKKKSF